MTGPLTLSELHPTDTFYLYACGSGRPCYYINSGQIYALDGTPAFYLAGSPAVAYGADGHAAYRVSGGYFYEPGGRAAMYFDPHELIGHELHPDLNAEPEKPEPPKLPPEAGPQIQREEDDHGGEAQARSGAKAKDRDQRRGRRGL